MCVCADVGIIASDVYSLLEKFEGNNSMVLSSVYGHLLKFIIFN